jgi:hypothetical protein
MSTRYFLDPNGQLLTSTEPDRCQEYYRLAFQAHQTEYGTPGFREIQHRLRAHLKHCKACSDWFVMHLALGETVEEPVFGTEELPVEPLPAVTNPYQPRPSRDWWRSMPRRNGQRLDRLYASLGRSA